MPQVLKTFANLSEAYATGIDEVCDSVKRAFTELGYGYKSDE